MCRSPHFLCRALTTATAWRSTGCCSIRPLALAPGPATQMAQNIIVSWLVGARLIELKTIQTLDELDVNKPCIDVEDEGYNVGVVPGIEGLRIVRRIPQSLGADPRPAPQVRLVRRPSRNGLQHERRLQPQGHVAAQRAVVFRRHGRRLRVPARLHRHCGGALSGRARHRHSVAVVGHDHFVDDARLPRPDEIEKISLYLLEDAGVAHLGQVQSDLAGSRSGPRHRQWLTSVR